MTPFPNAVLSFKVQLSRKAETRFDGPRITQELTFQVVAGEDLQTPADEEKRGLMNPALELNSSATIPGIKGERHPR